MALLVEMQEINGSMMFDLVINKDSQRFKTTNDSGEFISKTEIYYALCTNKRANDMELKNNLANSGHIGELFTSKKYPTGSKLWLLSSLPLQDENVISMAELYIRDALDYLLVSKRAEKIDVSFYIDKNNETFVAIIKIQTSDNKIFDFEFKIKN